MSDHAQTPRAQRHTNQLIHDKSPYLLQHAHNPVDWYPWGEEAFERAKAEDKPIFLSIGYSTCHWCHVMAHESFEDSHVAQMMNNAFISIKVDREERPDIDSVYMAVCQMMTGSGGWPLTIIMTPDKKPFFAATYIPKATRMGRIGMLELIPRIKEVWDTRRQEVFKSADEITGLLERSSLNEPGEEMGELTLRLAYEQFARRFDVQHGGFGGAPKFPTPHNFLFLLRYWKRTGNKMALEMVEKTLGEIRMGGVYDHVGFGVHRYSTDATWLLPHFEKMLYDQALLAMACIEAFQASGKETYAATAREIFTYVLRDMTDPEGGFYSAEDADSEGEEGKFYVWTEHEIRDAFSEEEAELMIKVFDVRKDGNFAEEATGRPTGGNILHMRQPLKALAPFFGMSEPDLQKRLEEMRERLFAHRKKRIHPHKDDKILTDWNGLMIAALAKGTQSLGDPQYAEAAKRAVDFVLKSMRTADGRLLHRYRDGQAAVPALVDDYVFLVWGLLEVYEATFDVQYLRTALELNQDLLVHFWDDRDGGFYSTADDGEQLLVRQKEIYDGAVPSGNSVAMWNLLRLGRITGNSELDDKAIDIARVFSKVVKQTPSSFTLLMMALDFGLGPTYEVLIAGEPMAEDTRAMIRALSRCFVPNKVVLFRPGRGESSEIDQIAPFTAYQTSLDGKATAYVCRNHACNRPTTDIQEMLELLDVTR